MGGVVNVPTDRVPFNIVVEVQTDAKSQFG